MRRITFGCGQINVSEILNLLKLFSIELKCVITTLERTIGTSHTHTHTIAHCNRFEIQNFEYNHFEKKKTIYVRMRTDFCAYFGSFALYAPTILIATYWERQIAYIFLVYSSSLSFFLFFHYSIFFFLIYLYEWHETNNERKILVPFSLFHSHLNILKRRLHRWRRWCGVYDQTINRITLIDNPHAFWEHWNINKFI